MYPFHNTTFIKYKKFHMHGFKSTFPRKKVEEKSPVVTSTKLKKNWDLGTGSSPLLRGWRIICLGCCGAGGNRELRLEMWCDVILRVHRCIVTVVSLPFLSLKVPIEKEGRKEGRNKTLCMSVCIHKNSEHRALNRLCESPFLSLSRQPKIKLPIHRPK